MGRSLFVYDSLSSPLSRVQHRIMEIPKGRQLRVNNQGAKVVLILNGEVKALVNDRVLGTAKRGDLLVVPGVCRQVYAPLDRRRGVSLDTLVIGFDPQLMVWDESLMQAVPIAKRGDAEMALLRAFGRLEIRKNVLSPAVQHSLDVLMREGEASREGGAIRVSAYTLLLLAEWASCRETTAVEKSAKLDRAAWLVEQTKHYLLEHHTEELTLDRIAWHLDVSGEHLARTFRKETGGTIFKHLEYLRVNRAKAELATTRASVQEIAEKAGFGTAAQLCRIFKRVTGETPLSYRLRMAENSSFSPSHTEEILF